MAVAPGPTPIRARRSALSNRPALATLRMAEEVRPPWVMRDTMLRVPIPNRSPLDLPTEDVLVWGSDDEAGHGPLVVRAESGVRTAYPWDDWNQYILSETYATWRRRPFYTRLPFSYRVIPAGLRYQWASNMCRSRQSDGLAFPAPLIEGGFEALRSVVRRFSMPAAPEPPRSRLCLTHDIDSRKGFRTVRDLCSVEESLGLRSSWNVVAGEYAIDEGLLESLADRGYEIGLHDYVHDNKLIFLPESELRRRLDKCRGFIERWNVAGFRSPSWFRSTALFRVLRDYVRYDCSSLDFDWLCPAGRGGALTASPFVFRGLIEIPTTVPLEAPLLEGCDPALVPAYWHPKLDWLIAVGGQVVVNTHPEREYTGNPAMLRSYARFLEDVLARCQGRWSLPRELAAEVAGGA